MAIIGINVEHLKIFCYLPFLESVTFAVTLACLENIESVPTLDSSADFPVTSVHFTLTVSFPGQSRQGPLYRRCDCRPLSGVVTGGLKFGVLVGY